MLLYFPTIEVEKYFKYNFKIDRVDTSCHAAHNYGGLQYIFFRVYLVVIPVCTYTYISTLYCTTASYKHWTLEELSHVLWSNFCLVLVLVVLISCFKPHMLCLLLSAHNFFLFSYLYLLALLHFLFCFQANTLHTHKTLDAVYMFLFVLHYISALRVTFF